MTDDAHDTAAEREDPDLSDPVDPSQLKSKGDDAVPESAAPTPLDILLEHVAEAPRAWVRAAAIWDSNEWAWKLAMFEVITGAPPEGWVEKRWEYEHAVLGAVEVPGATVASWFADGQLEIGMVSVPFMAQENIHVERYDSRQSRGDEPLPWPSVTWRTSTSDASAGTLHETLVGAGAPAFYNVELAVAAFFRLPPQTRGRGIGREIVFREQNLRARIEHVEIRPSEVSVTVGGSDRDGVYLTLSGHGGASRRLDSNGSEWSLPLPEGVPEGGWVALHDGRQLIDSRGLDPAGRLADDVEHYVEPGTRIEALISRGEGAMLEFKRELPSEDPRKVLKTIAAFSNGQGGTILFGVTDEQEIVGLGGTLDRDAIDRLTLVISDHVHPHPHFEIAPVAVGDTIVLVVDVWPGPDTPYGIGTNDRKLTYYVRRGGNSSPARPEDIRHSVKTRIPTDQNEHGLV